MATSPNIVPKVDIILVFRASNATLSKQEAREDADAAEKEYTLLLNTLRDAGLRATGKRGQKNGQILVFVWASSMKLAKLVQRERYVSQLTLLTRVVSKTHTRLPDTQTS